jgi:hypothetical protein
MVEQNFRFAAPLADRFMSWSTAASSRVWLWRAAGKMPVLNQLLGV